MPYIICNNDKYLRQTTEGHSIVNDVSQATQWNKLESANNVCKYLTQNKNLRNYHLAVKYVSKENNVVNSPAKQIELDFDILDKVKEMSSIVKKMEDRRVYLLEKIHEVDLEIVDIEHAAEFYTLNAAQGYKLYKLLHNTRNKRRMYKDELQKIDLSLGTTIRSVNMENLERSIKGLDTRQYAPRINKELFGG